MDSNYFSRENKPLKTALTEGNVEIIRSLLKRNGARGRWILQQGVDIIGLGGPNITKWVDLHKPLIGKTGLITSFELDAEVLSGQKRQIEAYQISSLQPVLLGEGNILDRVPNCLNTVRGAIYLDLDFCRWFETDWQGAHEAHMQAWSALARDKFEWVFMSITHCIRAERDHGEIREKIANMIVPWVDMGFNPEVCSVSTYRDPWGPPMINGMIALHDLEYRR